MREWAREVTPEMIKHPRCREIAEQIGVENLLKIIEAIGGTTTYFPTEDKVLLVARNQCIVAAFNGTNHLELAKKYGVTERWIREICAEGKAIQLTLFDEEQ